MLHVVCRRTSNKDRQQLIRAMWQRMSQLNLNVLFSNMQSLVPDAAFHALTLPDIHALEPGVTDQPIQVSASKSSTSNQTTESLLHRNNYSDHHVSQTGVLQGSSTSTLEYGC